MDRTSRAIRSATRNGLCPMCGKRPRARWKDTGDERITCGHPECFKKWIPGSLEIIKNEGVLPTKQEE